MKTFIFYAVLVFGLMQTACEMKIASDNQIASNNNIPIGNTVVNNGAGVPPINPLASPASTPVPITTSSLPSALPTTSLSPSSVEPGVMNDHEKSEAVRSSLLSTFARGTVSTFQFARTPASVPVPKPVVLVKAPSDPREPYVALAKETSLKPVPQVESAR